MRLPRDVSGRQLATLLEGRHEQISDLSACR